MVILLGPYEFERAAEWKLMAQQVPLPMILLNLDHHTEGLLIGTQLLPALCV